MPRPQSPRRISEELAATVFKPRGVPVGELETLELTLDGLEALRLADLEGLYQEEAARRMGISRPTFARIVAEARQIVARALLEGKALTVQGGTVERGAQKAWPCPVHGQRRRRGRGCRCEALQSGGKRHGDKSADGGDRQ